MDKNIPFPQADDFDKIIQILHFPNDEDLNDIIKISSRLGDISDRQVSYYVSAAMFLGFVEVTNGKRVFSKHAIAIKNMNTYMQNAEIISTILLNPVFNKTYVYSVLFGQQEPSVVADILNQYYPDYSDAIYKRRAQTVISWVNWVISHLS